jgi:hypothetical protein
LSFGSHYRFISAGLHGLNIARRRTFLREQPDFWLRSRKLILTQCRLPSPIPSEIRVPSWAFMDISVGLSLKSEDTPAL